MPQDLYVLPGTMCDARLWESLSTALGTDVRLHHIAIPDKADIHSIAESLFEALPRSPCNLLGFSLGGYLGAYLACHQPHRFEQLMVVANLPAALPEQEIQQRRNILRWLEHNEYQGMPEARLRQFLHPKLQASSAAQLIRQMDKDLGHKVLQQQLSATTERPDLLPALAAIPITVSFCVGQQDKLVDIPRLKQLAKGPQRHLRQVADCGHMLPLEQPQALANFILSQLT